MAGELHKPRNAMMWKSDPLIDAARKAPGWSEFHRECGKQWLYFDEIEREGRGYRALAYTARKVSDGFYQRTVVARGMGRGVIDAVLAAFDGAHDAGFHIDYELRALLDGSPPPVTGVIDFDDLIGGGSTIDLEDLIG